MKPGSSGEGNSTAQETFPEAEPDVVAQRGIETLGLVVLSCRSQPDRIGALLPIPLGDSILGRGPSQATDPHPRVSVFRQRLGFNEALPPFEAPALSRVLLGFRRTKSDGIHVQKLGRTRVYIADRETDSAVVKPGDVIQVGLELSLLCVERPARFAPSSASAHVFGEADEDGIVGEAPVCWELRERIAFVGPRAGHVLLRGDSGVGKELVAGALHRASKRGGAFVCRNAVTIPDSLIDAELFGNIEGYPNPGMRERKGLIGSADRGTLLLDEFAELPMSQQAHLLRVLDAGEYQRLGEAKARRSDLRLIAATNRPLSALREDVLARFEFRLEIPDLRARREDVPLLIRHLFRRLAASEPALGSRFCDAQGEPRFSAKLVSRLASNPPPGNIRGLRQALWAALEQSTGDTIEAPAEREDSPAASSEDGAPELDATGIEKALNASGGSIEKARQMLGLSSRFVLMRAMKKYGIEVRRSATSKS